MKQVDVIIPSQPKKTYQITIGANLFCRAEELISPFTLAKDLLVITDENTATFFPSLAKGFSNKYRLLHLSLPAGENAKNIEHLSTIWEFALTNKLGRDCAFIALGGGVIGDVTGFAAATYMRGVDFIQVPTTLLAFVDASIGGKTAINFQEGKNIIGAFYQPKAVLIDTNTLSSLPKREYLSGIAEIAKYAFIDKSNLFTLLSSPDYKLRLPEIIETCVNIKAKVIAKDEQDKTGQRAILNFGHTIGHALEAIGNFKTYTHGEAIAKGMGVAFNIAYARKLISEEYLTESFKLMSSLELDISIPNELNANKIYTLMQLDKKLLGGKINFILSISRGEVKVFNDISEKEVISALALSLQRKL